MSGRLIKLVLLAMWTALCAFIAIKMVLQGGWLYALCIGALTVYLVRRVVQEIRTMRADARGAKRGPTAGNRAS